MAVLLYVDFPYDGPFGDGMTERMKDLASSIALEPGIISKIWTENSQTKEAGGVYQFATREDAERYLAMHAERLKRSGVAEVRAKFFSINDALTELSMPPK